MKLIEERVDFKHRFFNGLWIETRFKVNIPYTDCTFITDLLKLTVVKGQNWMEVKYLDLMAIIGLFQMLLDMLAQILPTIVTALTNIVVAFGW